MGISAIELIQLLNYVDNEIQFSETQKQDMIKELKHRRRVKRVLTGPQYKFLQANGTKLTDRENQIIVDAEKALERSEQPSGVYAFVFPDQSTRGDRWDRMCSTVASAPAACVDIGEVFADFVREGPKWKSDRVNTEVASVQ